MRQIFAFPLLVKADSPPDNTSNFNNITVRRSGIKNTSKNHHNQSKKHSRLSITSGKYVSVSKTNKKRVSVCGEGFSEDILQIDETILDEYENELDLKKGKLFIIDESDIEKDTNASYNNYDVGQLSIINETYGSQTEIVVLDSSSYEQPIRGLFYIINKDLSFLLKKIRYASSKPGGDLTKNILFRPSNTFKKIKKTKILPGTNTGSSGNNTAVLLLGYQDSRQPVF